MRRAKISIIGSGNIGGECARSIAMKELGDVVLVDIPIKDKPELHMPKGKALDLACCGPVENFDSKITGTFDYADIKDSDVIIVTAGVPRKPGQSRDDLVSINAGIVKSVAQNIKQYAPNAIVIVVSNPLDAMVYVMWKVTGFPANRVIGQAGALDVARYKTFLAMELGVSVEDIQGLLLGGHGDDMVPLPRLTSVNGIPVSDLLPAEVIQKCVDRAKVGGGEYGVANANGGKGLFVGVPCVLGSNGVEKILSFNMNETEQKAMNESISHVKDLIGATVKLFPELA
jgi:malate dehydrogenase